MVLGGVGGYIGYNLQTWEEELLVSVNEKRLQRGMTPITRQTLDISSLMEPTKDE